jgi:hypothetical protein
MFLHDGMHILASGAWDFKGDARQSSFQLWLTGLIDRG